ncbi:MAG: enoyl-CoA hydratase/isomerase family protein [Planctomycetes bacterium]|nr:enoyl-CoA hydratase/isomerase family protein [Planctomycetota bacterium]
MDHDATYDIDSEGIATVCIDRAHKRVNTLTRAIVAELSDALTSIEKRGSIRGLILASGKPTTFAAGADLNELLACTRTDLDRLLREGQALCSRIERLNWPTVAAINGHCLGGGYELALACRTRVAADDPKTLIGLPEVALGLLPAWGGTVRLCRLIGVKTAAPLLFAGTRLSPADALRLGLVDRLAPRNDLPAAARGVLDSPRRRHGSLSRVLEAWSPVRRAILRRARTRVVGATPDLVQAIDRVARAIHAACAHGAAAGFECERQGLLELLDTPDSRQRLQAFLQQRSSAAPAT